MNLTGVLTIEYESGLGERVIQSEHSYPVYDHMNWEGSGPIGFSILRLKPELGLENNHIC